MPLHNDYRDDMATLEKAVHAAILKRFDALDAAINTLGEHHAARHNELHAKLEASRVSFSNTRLARILRAVGLI